MSQGIINVCISLLKIILLQKDSDIEEQTLLNITNSNVQKKIVHRITFSVFR